MKKIGKIGVFDSGFGGLSILKGIIKYLPQYNYLYLGDTARTPYGNRSQEVIYEFTKQGVNFLFNRGAEIVILACNTASSEALRRIQREYLPKHFPDKKVLGVLIPGAEEAVLQTSNKKIAILATCSTVSSGSFKREIFKLNKNIFSYEISAPLLVPIVEAGEEKSLGGKEFIGQYARLIKKTGADTLLLGCTHYGLLEHQFRKELPGIKVLSGGVIVGKKLKDYFEKHIEIKNKLSKKINIEFFTTDSKGAFEKLGSRFFGKTIKAKKVQI